MSETSSKRERREYPANSVSNIDSKLKKAMPCMHWYPLVEEPNYSNSNIPNTWSWRKKNAV